MEHFTSYTGHSHDGPNGDPPQKSVSEQDIHYPEPIFKQKITGKTNHENRYQFPDHLYPSPIILGNGDGFYPFTQKNTFQKLCIYNRRKRFHFLILSSNYNNVCHLRDE